jgi:K+-sensing histidine kinase KdpD
MPPAEDEDNQPDEIANLRQRIAQLEEANQQLQTDLHTLETALQQARADAERAERARTTFLAMMSHDLRTPLHIILGFAEALQEDVYGSPGEQQRMPLQSITQSGQQLLGLIDNLLDLARLEAGTIVLQDDLLHREWLLRRSLVAIQEEAKQQGIVLVVQDTEHDFSFQADARRLSRVLVLLLNQAIHLTQPGQQVGIDVSLLQGEGQVMCSVWNTSSRVSSERLHALFHELEFDEPAHVLQYEGFGVEAMLVSRLVALQQGSIAVEPHAENGCRFVVTVPTAPASPE